ERLRTTIGAEDRDVLDAHAEATRNVDTRLERERHARSETLRVPADEIGRLVAVEADAVAEAVDEVRAVAGLVDHRARGGVHGLGGHALARRAIAGFLRAEHDVVDATLLVLDGSSDVDGARD